MKIIPISNRVIDASIIIVFLLIEYLWFRSGLHWQGIKTPRLGISISSVNNPSVLLLALICLRLMLSAKKILSFAKTFFKQIKAELIEKNNRNQIFYFVLILFLAIAIRLPALMYAEGHINADEATEGIMAMHIYQGKHHPINHYEAPYFASTKPHLTALLFSITGVTPKALEASNLLIFTAFFIFFYILVRQIFDYKIALLTAMFTGISPPFLYYQSLNIGGYIEILLYGTVVMLLVLKCVKLELKDIKLWYFNAIGFFLGFGFWIQPLMIVFIVTALVILFIKSPLWFFKYVLWRIILFFLIGCFPLLLYNLKTHGKTISFLLHPPKAVKTSAITEKVKIAFLIVFNALGNIDIKGHVLRLNHKWNASLIVTVVYLFTFVYYVVGIGKRFYTRGYKEAINTNKKHLILILFGIVVLSANFRSFRPVPEGRYALPLYLCILPSLSFWLLTLKRKYIRCIIIFLLICNNIYFISTQVLYHRERKIEFMSLISALKRLNIQYVGTGYWLAYPLTFITREKIIFTGHYGLLSRKADENDPVSFDRYPPYWRVFYKNLKSNPQHVAFVFEDEASEYDENFISTIKKPMLKETIGKYDIYTFAK